MTDFTHLDAKGRVRMVDVSEKDDTRRVAIARGRVLMKQETLERIIGSNVKKAMYLRRHVSPV